MLHVQMDMEEATLTGQENTQIDTDYEKFYDTFDPSFFRELLIHVGLPVELADMTYFMYSKIQRRFKIGQHLGNPFPSTRGAGQGDTMSTIGAHIVTSIQFRVIQHRHPTVKTGSIIDDRNFRGPKDDVIAAVRSALHYDATAV